MAWKNAEWRTLASDAMSARFAHRRMGDEISDWADMGLIHTMTTQTWQVRKGPPPDPHFIFKMPSGFRR